MTTVHDPIIREVGDHFAIPFDVLRAQVEQESSGDPFAFRFEPAFFDRYIRGRDVPGARFGPLAACSFGLLQILLETALELGFTDRPERLFEPRVGLTYGVRYLVQCRDRAHGDLFVALQHYNGAGEAALRYARSVWVRAGRGDIQHA